jgi:hypothetical protein
MLVAFEYLRLSASPLEYADIEMGKTAGAFSNAMLDAAEWSQTMMAANLASAAVRLASADEIIEKDLRAARSVYSDCRTYFHRNPKKRSPDDDRGRTCSTWFHVMLRDAIAHRELEETPDPDLEKRYEDRHLCITRTTFGQAHSNLLETANDLSGDITALGIVVPGIQIFASPRARPRGSGAA